MSNQQKIEIAKDFISRHKKNNLDDWFNSLLTTGSFSDEHKYLAIFNYLTEGHYGHVEEDDSWDNTVYRVEIGKHESKSGQAVLFEWEYGDQE